MDSLSKREQGRRRSIPRRGVRPASEHRQGARDVLPVIMESLGRLRAGQENIEKRIEETRTGLERRIEETRTGLERRIEETRTGLEKRIDETKEGLERRIDETKEGLEGRIDETKEGLERRIDETKEGLEKRIDETTDALGGRIGDNKESIKGIQGRLDAIPQIRSDIARLEQSVAPIPQIRSDIARLDERSRLGTRALITIAIAVVASALRYFGAFDYIQRMASPPAAEVAAPAEGPVPPAGD